MTSQAPAAAPILPNGPRSRLSSYLWRFAPRYVVGGLMLLCFQVAMNRIDWLSKQAIDTIFGRIPSTTPADAMRPAIIMLVLAVVAFIVRVASRMACFNAGRDIEYQIRGRLLERLHRLGFAFYRRLSAGEIMSRATSDLTQIRMLTGFGVMNMINIVFALASALQVMLKISPRLTLVSLTTVPLLMLLTRTFSGKMFQRTQKVQETLGKLTEFVQSNLAGIRVVRSFGIEANIEQRFEDLNQRYLNTTLQLAKLRGLMFPVTGAVAALGLLLFFWYGSTLLLRGPEQGGITEGGFFAFSLALARMTWPLIAAGFLIAIVQRGRVSFNRLCEIIDAEPDLFDGSDALPTPVQGELTVKGLSHSYGPRAVLSDVSFSLPAGSSLAIVGRTGSGKSTLAMLLARLIPTPKGTVFLDGKDVCDLALREVRSTVGYAQQDAFLFSTTVARNIGLMLDEPDSPRSQERLQQAASDAQILSEVQGLPEQLDTIVGERGVQLSGGQKQRVALARALLWQPKLLILDDPLSAVDAKTESAILQSIEKQAAQRSLLLITHRVAAAARCQQILVLDQGQVVESGTHEQLIAKGGIYATFAEEQRMASELDELGASDLPGREVRP
jgi:ATP-binding cassette subfamily B protein